jgi:hypothetical protein
MAKMNISPVKAKKLALALLRANRRGRSWREISAMDYGGQVHFATLNRIAIHKGAWLPKDERILELLGLIVKRSPYAVMPRYFQRTPDALAWFLHKRELAKGIATDTRKAQKGMK